MRRPCERCAGPVLEEADGEITCLHCGLRVADAGQHFIAVLADEVLRLEERERAKELARGWRPRARRWDAVG